MSTIKRFCDALSFLLMGATACFFSMLIFLAQGGEIRLPSGNTPKVTEHTYSKSDRNALEAKYRELMSNM